jgi:hypothetical protein
MASRKAWTVALTAVGAFALAFALFGVLWMVNEGHSFAQCSGLLGWGWSVPLLASFVIGGVVWFLSTQSPRPRGVSQEVETGECPECDASVLPTWRLCPACGTRLPPGSGSAGA